MTTNPLLAVRSLGQSIWLDQLSPELLTSGKLASLIKNDGLGGAASSSPAYEHAVAGPRSCDGRIRSLSAEGKSPAGIAEALMLEDIRSAADLFRALHTETGGADGFVSIGVSPLLAHDTEGTIREARRLIGELDRPNIMIRIPGTAEGIPAIRSLTAEGFNLDVTPLSGPDRYRQAAEAWIEGVEERLSEKKPVDAVASAAGFFLSRIDVLVDPILENYLIEDEELAETAAYLRGKTALASAKAARLVYRELFGSSRFARLRKHGVRPQRLLWTDTGTQDPRYSDVKYVEPLIGPDTVNALPLETLEAFRDHGSAANSLDSGGEEAKYILSLLPSCGIYLSDVTVRLEKQGLRKAAEAWKRLTDAVEKILAGP